VNAEPKKEIKYDEAQFQAAYRALVQISHGLRLIEVNEVIRWIKKLPMNDINDPQERDGRERLYRLLESFNETREVMRSTGVPRDPMATETVD
jgi:hypothetical protein